MTKVQGGREGGREGARDWRGCMTSIVIEQRQRQSSQPRRRIVRWGEVKRLDAPPPCDALPAHILVTRSSCTLVALSTGLLHSSSPLRRCC